MLGSRFRNACFGCIELGEIIDPAATARDLHRMTSTHMRETEEVIHRAQLELSMRSALSSLPDAKLAQRRNELASLTKVCANGQRPAHSQLAWRNVSCIP